MPILTFHLLLGSNEGNREAHLLRALDALRARAVVVGVSSVYETAPWGFQQQPDFLNQAVEVIVESEPEAFMLQLKQMEKEAGRVAAPRWGPRVLDIDLLLAEDRIIHTSQLIVPHPRLHERRFALVPLAEIAPNAIHPLLGLSVSALLSRCTDPLPVRIVYPAHEV
ncbi:MAG: 2-amino-4-hydroxy-6-hydroxymethyldihydropteridine diphosphokinase [Chitinophagales bacterium]|nr:MAG: 2-amino-4-hydroxy-6-hydroxymethyldihydropteridine diphosphokinase [Chitinophagales bacterium]